jgi:hypothetical protein
MDQLAQQKDYDRFLGGARMECDGSTGSDNSEDFDVTDLDEK